MSIFIYFAFQVIKEVEKPRISKGPQTSIVDFASLPIANENRWPTKVRRYPSVNPFGHLAIDLLGCMNK